MKRTNHLVALNLQVNENKPDEQKYRNAKQIISESQAGQYGKY
jgi:hypothetical protein